MSEPVAGAGVGPVSVVARAADHLDAFAAGVDGRIYTAAWQPGDTEWHGWWALDGLEVAPCAPVAAVSRTPDHLDVFAVGLDGRVHTTAWEPGGTWQGWRVIGTLQTTLHALITAVSRSDGKLDIFTSSSSGHVHTAAWEPGDTEWHGWWPVADLRVPPGAPVTAVVRSVDHLDIFVTGMDHRVHAAAWQPGDEAWGGWWTVGTLQVLPRTQVGVVSRSQDKIDLFATDAAGRVHTTAWEEGETTWPDWWSLPELATDPGAAVTAVSRSADKLDVFAVGSDGAVWAAAWEPGFPQWEGWWRVGDLTTQRRLPIGVATRSQDKLDVLAPRAADGQIVTAAWEPGESAWGGWWTVGDLRSGMTDPGVSSWQHVGTALGLENSAYSHKGQGATTDGEAWYFSSNGSKTIRKYANGAQLLGEVGVPAALSGSHVGAPGRYEDWIFVPIQGPFGVWKVRTDLGDQAWLADADQAHGRFPWCDVNPLNGRLYTSEFDHWNNANGVLFAYDRDTLERCPEDDLHLGPTPIHFDRIQGGVFTGRGRVIVSRSDPNGIFCFSAVTGACLGGRPLGDFGSFKSEVEGVTVRTWHFGDTIADVHVLELDNDAGTSDSYLHSFSVPDRQRL